MEEDRVEYNPVTRMVTISTPGRTPFRYRARREHPIGLTQKRRTNLQKAFDKVQWDFDNSVLHNYGLWGDRQQFDIPGKLGNWTVRYRHQSPSGQGYATLVVWDEHGHRIDRFAAPLREATKIQEYLLSRQSAQKPRRQINITMVRK